jgi:predicted nucleic acid-binding protein
MILVDTSVLLDILQNDPVWATWSIAALNIGRGQGEVAINGIVFAELSGRYDRVEDVEAVISTLKLNVRAIPHEALFLSGRAFRRYRAQGGSRNSVLSDFFIGAHAAVEDARLLTRDVRNVRSYFPDVMLITP